MSTQIVEFHSAILAGYDKSALPANHVEMTKPRSHQDTIYKRVSGQLATWASDLAGARVSTQQPPQYRPQQHASQQHGATRPQTQQDYGMASSSGASTWSYGAMDAAGHQTQSTAREASPQVANLQVALPPGMSVQQFQQLVQVQKPQIEAPHS